MTKESSVYFEVETMFYNALGDMAESEAVQDLITAIAAFIESREAKNDQPVADNSKASD